MDGSSASVIRPSHLTLRAPIQPGTITRIGKPCTAGSGAPLSSLARRTSGAQRLGKIDRPSESEPVAVALHFIEADELDVACPLADSHRPEQIVEGNAGPLPRADRLRAPRQLARQRAHDRSSSRRSPAQTSVAGRTAGETRGGAPRARSSAGDPPARPPRGASRGIDMGNGGVAAGEELVDRGYEAIGSNGPDPGVEAFGIMDESTAIGAGADDLDRGIRSNRAALQHPGEPSSPARQRPNECGPALEPDIGQRMENRARIAGLAHLQHDLAEAHTHAWP